MRQRPLDRRPGTSIATGSRKQRIVDWQYIAPESRVPAGRLLGGEPTFDLAEQRRGLVAATAKPGEEAPGVVAPVLA
jgi:hypothetical protein